MKMTLTRDSLQRVMEIVDEARQRVQDARLAADEESRRESLETAERAVRTLESLMAEAEA